MIVGVRRLDPEPTPHPPRPPRRAGPHGPGPEPAPRAPRVPPGGDPRGGGRHRLGPGRGRDHFEPAVRAAAVSSLGVLLADSTVNEIILLLDDPDDRVRAEALTVLSKLKMAASPELIHKISGLIANDPSLAVQTNGIVVLARLGAAKEAMSDLAVRLDSDDPQIRTAALETLGRIASFSNGSFDTQPILHALEDPSPAIRRAAVTALGSLKGEATSKTLVKYLNDADERVRNTAAKALRRRGPESRALVLEILDSDLPLIDTALDALAPGDPESLAPLRAYAQREVIHARVLRRQFASFPAACGPAVALLRDRLLRRQVDDRRLPARGNARIQPECLDLKSMRAVDRDHARRVGRPRRASPRRMARASRGAHVLSRESPLAHVLRRALRRLQDAPRPPSTTTRVSQSVSMRP